jgi:hypothetical protein
VKAGEVGLLGLDVDEQYGGGGVADFRYSLVITEELCRAGASALTVNISGFNDLVAPYRRAALPSGRSCPRSTRYRMTGPWGRCLPRPDGIPGVPRTFIS